MHTENDTNPPKAISLLLLLRLLLFQNNFGNFLAVQFQKQSRKSLTSCTLNNNNKRRDEVRRERQIGQEHKQQNDRKNEGKQRFTPPKLLSSALSPDLMMAIPTIIRPVIHGHMPFLCLVESCLSCPCMRFFLLYFFPSPPPPLLTAKAHLPDEGCHIPFCHFVTASTELKEGKEKENEEEGVNLFLRCLSFGLLQKNSESKGEKKLTASVNFIEKEGKEGKILISTSKK